MGVNRLSNSCPKSAISVSEMAMEIGLSRSRFYGLMEGGKFPPPIYDLKTRRPFYDERLQDICLQIRQTGIAYDNCRIMFNTIRQKPNERPQTAHVAQTVESETHDTHNDHDDLVEALAEMGVKTTSQQIDAAIKNIYPDGHNDIDEGVLLADLFRVLRNKGQ